MQSWAVAGIIHTWLVRLLLTQRVMKERDGKQWCALIGWIRFLCFDLLPPHYSGGSDRCVSVEVFVAFLNNVNKFLGCYKGGEIFSLSMCVLFIINIPPCGCCRCRCIFILLVFILKASSLFFSYSCKWSHHHISSV